MRAEKRRQRGLFRTFAFGLVLGVYSCGLTAAAAQQPEIQPPPEVAAQPTIIWMEEGNTRPASTKYYDPVSRVPNFFGDFVARPSAALVNQPRISTVATDTFSFLGNPSDTAGGVGPNTFYAPITFGGPGGPYKILTDVTGLGLDFPPVSILNENAELTAKIQANFPGATFGSGLGLLFRPFFVSFEYFLSGGQTAPGLVALVNLPNPAGGGLAGRNKYFDDGSPLPRDRVFFDYNHVADFQVLGRTFNINRYVFGAEKTFLNGFGSVEVRVPFAGTANSTQQGGQGLEVNNTEFGNVGLLLKGTLFRNANWIVSAGVGVSMPTADDSRLLFAGKPIIEIRNDAWLVQPIIGAAWAPNDRLYVQAGVQFDFDANGNPVYTRSIGGQFGQRGVLTDQTYVYASGAIGYWLYQSDTGRLSGVSLQGELHYNRTLGDRDAVLTGSVLVADLRKNLDVLNATAGVHFELGDRTTFSVGVGAPVAGDELNDWNLMARLNIRFGRIAR